jgi:acetyl esterase/lipase
MQLRLLDVIGVDPDVRELLARWAISPAVPVSELTAEAVREDDRGVLALQRIPGALHGVEDVEVMGLAGPLFVRVYRPGPGRLHPVLFLYGGGFVIGREGYDAPLRDLALAAPCPHPKGYQRTSQHPLLAERPVMHGRRSGGSASESRA